MRRTSSANRTLGTAVAAVFALLAAPMTVGSIDGSRLDVISAVHAAESDGAKGHSGGGTGATGGPKQGARGKGGQSVVKASQVSGSKMGRLNMARAFVSPGFDISKVDDPLAPIAQIALYKELITSDPTGTNVEAAGVALGNAATVNPVTLETVTKINTILAVTTTFNTAQLQAVADKATETLLSRRTEEE